MRRFRPLTHSWRKRKQTAGMLGLWRELWTCWWSPPQDAAHVSHSHIFWESITGKYNCVVFRCFVEYSSQQCQLFIDKNLWFCWLHVTVQLKIIYVLFLKWKIRKITYSMLRNVNCKQILAAFTKTDSLYKSNYFIFQNFRVWSLYLTSPQTCLISPICVGKWQSFVFSRLFTDSGRTSLVHSTSQRETFPAYRCLCSFYV